MTTTEYHAEDRQLGECVFPAGWYAVVTVPETGLIKTRGPFATEDEAKGAWER